MKNVLTVELNKTLNKNILVKNPAKGGTPARESKVTENVPTEKVSITISFKSDSVRNSP